MCTAQHCPALPLLHCQRVSKPGHVYSALHKERATSGTRAHIKIEQFMRRACPDLRLTIGHRWTDGKRRATCLFLCRSRLGCAMKRVMMALASPSIFDSTSEFPLLHWTCANRESGCCTFSFFILPEVIPLISLQLFHTMRVWFCAAANL